MTRNLDLDQSSVDRGGQIKVESRISMLGSKNEEWQPVASAPFDTDLELAVLDRTDTHSLVFRCRRNAAGWVNAITGKKIEVSPTHWRAWPASRSGV